MKNKTIPDEDYFKKIWNDIEYKSPIGEKYYLRYVFISLIFLLFMAGIIVFFLEFNKNISLLNTLIKRNQYLDKVKSLNIFDGKEYLKKEIINGVQIEFNKDSKYLITHINNGAVLNIYKGEFLIFKKNSKQKFFIKSSLFEIELKKGKIYMEILNNMGKITPIFSNQYIKINNKLLELKEGDEYFIIKNKIFSKSIKELK